MKRFVGVVGVVVVVVVEKTIKEDLTFTVSHFLLPCPPVLFKPVISNYIFHFEIKQDFQISYVK